jgi:hypothetical protein
LITELWKKKKRIEIINPVTELNIKEFLIIFLKRFKSFLPKEYPTIPSVENA